MEPHAPSQRGGPHIQVSGGGATAMSHYVRLDALPEGLEFPDDLKKRISYDAEKRRLIFHGFMSKGDYDRLASLHRDLAYVRAIEGLFQISTEADAPQFRRISLVLAILVMLCLILAVVVWWQLLREPSSSLPNETKTNSSSASKMVGRNLAYFQNVNLNSVQTMTARIKSCTAHSLQVASLIFLRPDESNTSAFHSASHRSLSISLSQL